MDAKRKTFIEVLKAKMGNVSEACKEIGISRKTFYEWKKTDVEFLDEVESIDEYLLDFAEHSLFSQIKAKNTAATIFYLKTKGKKRGYVERSEVEQVGTPRFVLHDARGLKNGIEKEED